MHPSGSITTGSADADANADASADVTPLLKRAKSESASVGTPPTALLAFQEGSVPDVSLDVSRQSEPQQRKPATPHPEPAAEPIADPAARLASPPPAAATAAAADAMMVHMFAEDLAPVKAETEADVSDTEAAAAAATAPAASAAAVVEGLHSLAFLEFSGHMPEPVPAIVKEEERRDEGPSEGEGEAEEDVVGEEDFVQAFWFTRVRGSEEQREVAAGEDDGAQGQEGFGHMLW